MGFAYGKVLPFPPEEVFAWHARPGALRRLLPPWLPAKLLEEPVSLRDGRAVLGLPLGLHLTFAQVPSGYEPPHRFVDELASPPLGDRGWRHTRLFSAEGEGQALVEDQVGSMLPARLLREIFSYRHRQLAGDLAAHAGAALLAGAGAWPMTIAMTGSSGLIGSELAAFLTSGGHQVVRLVRRAPRDPGERRWDPARPEPGLLAGVDAVVHLAGAPIAGRWSEGHKVAVKESRLGPTRRLAEAAAEAAKNAATWATTRAATKGASRRGGPFCFVTASAVGYYGYDRGDEVLTEASGQGEGFLAGLVGEWEAATAPAAEAGLRVVNIRTGIVLSPRGGALGLAYPAFLAGLGGTLGDGRQWTSWISVDDLLDVYLRALTDRSVAGPLNAVSPTPVTNAEYTRALARVLRRPALVPVPPALLGLVFGSEGAREFALAGQRVVPLALEKAGHRFRHPEVEVALRHLLGRCGG